MYILKLRLFLYGMATENLRIIEGGGKPFKVYISWVYFLTIPEELDFKIPQILSR